MMAFASIDAHTRFIFKVDPYNINWGYSLRTQTTDTYGGKVVQILGVELGTLTIDTVAGGAGQPYLEEMKKFFREMGLWQQEYQTPATFNFPPKNYTLKFWGQRFTYQDSVDNIVFPVQITGLIQADIGGNLKQSIMTEEIKKLAAGIGYTKSIYNDPEMGEANVAKYEAIKNFQPDPATGTPTTGSSTVSKDAAAQDASAFAGGNWGPENLQGNASNTSSAIAFIKREFGLTDVNGWRASGSVGTSDHPKGKAIDAMIPDYQSTAGIAKGDSVANWFINNPDAFGTKYVIWRERINTDGVWAPYSHPDGNDDNLAHRNHVHISLKTS